GTGHGFAVSVVSSGCLMKSRWLWPALLSAMPMWAFQGTTPQAALEEIATTTKSEVLARHLPEPIQKSIEILPKLKKQEFMDKLLSLKAEQLNSCTVRPAHDSDGWEIIDEKGVSQGKVKLENAFISGMEAMLPLRIESEGDAQVFIVTMHLEG